MVECSFCMREAQGSIPCTSIVFVKGLGTIVLESYLQSFLPHHECSKPLFYKRGVAHVEAI